MNSFCGPYALGYVLGITPDEAAKLIRDATGQKAIFGVRSIVMERLLARHAVVTGHLTYGSSKPTLAKWLKSHPSGLFVVNVTGHFIVVNGPKIYDNSWQNGVARRLWPSRRVRVKGYWQLAR